MNMPLHQSFFTAPSVSGQLSQARMQRDAVNRSEATQGKLFDDLPGEHPTRSGHVRDRRTAAARQRVGLRRALDLARMTATVPAGTDDLPARDLLARDRAVSGRAVHRLDDRMAATGAREWPLRALQEADATAAGAGGSPGRFSAWLGHSGRRHVMSVFDIGDEAAFEFEDAVVLAVDAHRRILGVQEVGPFGAGGQIASWREAMRQAGATMVHIHLLAATAAARAAVMADLAPRA